MNIRGRSNRKMRRAKKEAKGTDWIGLSDDGRVKPERDFRSVWSADAQAHSSTLQSRVRGGGVKKRTDEI